MNSTNLLHHPIEITLLFSTTSVHQEMVTMDHYIADLNESDVAEVEKRTNTTGDNISGIALVVF
jgi:hypothetical protein